MRLAVGMLATMADSPDDRALLAALGPLAPLYLDSAVTEIRVDSPDRVSVVRRGSVQDVSTVFSSSAEVRVIIDATLALSGLALGRGHTVGESRLADGSHFIAIIPPTSGDQPCLAIQRLSRSPLDWDKFVELKVLSDRARVLLANFVRGDVGILVAGTAGSGKTTLANLIAESIPTDQRIVVVRDIVDVPVHHPRSVRLEANALTGVTVIDLVETALRLQPDWLVVGELRGPETFAVLRAMSGGPRGLTTIHANSSEDALLRLEALCSAANAGLGSAEIRSVIASSIQVVVFQERLPDGRRLTQIGDVHLVGDRVEVRALMRYSPATDRLETAGLPAEQRIKEYLSSGFADAQRRVRRSILG